jgi:hypothetical protein
VIGPPADVPVHVFSIATPARLAPIRAGKWRVESGCDGKGSGDNREDDAMFTTMAFDHSSLRWFEINT